MKSQHSMALAVSISAILAACGGGGDGVSPTSSATSYILKGTVPGTLIESFCDDGSYHSTKSNNNGTNRHPFELLLPTGQSCRLVMTTNEDDTGNKVVTPIRLITASGQGGIAFTGVAGQLDLGHVDLPLSRDKMLADVNDDGVEDFPRELSLSSEQSERVNISLAARDPLDADNDGIINEYEDDDGDRLSNRDDSDDDNDGIPDEFDDDRDNDGRSDNDLDGDGISNDHDVDDDNDGRHDDIDEDDNDGQRDADDTDDDNDSIDDSEDRDDDGGEGDEDGENEDRDDSDYNDYNSGNSGGIVPASAPSAGRLLASQCAQCHGTDGYSRNGIDSLAGESAAELIEEMLEMNQENDNEIMHKQAKGYSDEQIRLIAEYLAQSTGGGNDDD